MIKIISAFYSSKDVTDIVTKYFNDNKISFLVSNNIFGDPLPNVVKYLKIKYEDNGDIKEISFIEGAMCILPIHKNLKIENFKEDVSYAAVNNIDKIKFIIPTPDSSYYLWQVLVQINNFRKLGYEIDAHYPVCCFNNNMSDTLKMLSESVNIKAHFHIYNDSRENKSYSASMKPWLMAQYFKEFPEEKNNIYIYLDPDVIFLQPMDFSKFIDDDIWYESDTSSYLNSRYIKSKGEQLFYEMCDIVGIPFQIVLDNDINCGGAQYITKNNTFEFWNEVEKTSVPLYKHMVDTATKYKPEGDPYPIQAWTSEMWTTNWCLWKHGIITKCVPELDFHWADHKMKDLKHGIFHNAGVVKTDDISFCKTAYQKSPFKQDIKVSEESISYKYLEEVKDTEMNFPELIDIFNK